MVRDVLDIVILEAAQNMRDGVDFADIGQKLVSETLALRRAAEAVTTGRLAPASLYTHTYGLDELGEALEAARTRPEGFLKALVRMD